MQGAAYAGLPASPARRPELISAPDRSIHPYQIPAPSPPDGRPEPKPVTSVQAVAPCSLRQRAAGPEDCCIAATAPPTIQRAFDTFFARGCEQHACPQRLCQDQLVTRIEAAFPQDAIRSKTAPGDGEAQRVLRYLRRYDRRPAPRLPPPARPEPPRKHLEQVVLDNGAAGPPASQAIASAVSRLRRPWRGCRPARGLRRYGRTGTGRSVNARKKSTVCTISLPSPGSASTAASSKRPGLQASAAPARGGAGPAGDFGPAPGAAQFFRRRRHAGSHRRNVLEFLHEPAVDPFLQPPNPVPFR